MKKTLVSIKESAKKRLRAWLGVDVLEQENARLRQTIMCQADRVTDRITELDELTRMDVDIGYRGPCTVILTGVYRGKGYVTFYEMDHGEFQYHVDMMKHMRGNHLVRNIDAPYGSNRPYAFQL